MTGQAERANRAIDAAGDMLAGEQFRRFAAIFRGIMGDAYDASQFVRNVGNTQLNRVKLRGQAGLDPAANPGRLLIATGGTFVDGGFALPCPNDRFRMILGVKLQLVTAEDAEDPDTYGLDLVPDGVQQQLAALGLLALNRRTGTAVVQSFNQFCVMAPNARNFDGAGTLAAAQPATPWELQLVPQGIGMAQLLPIDALNPNDETTFEFRGLNGVDCADDFTDDLVAIGEALVWDCVKSGQ